MTSADYARYASDSVGDGFRVRVEFGDAFGEAVLCFGDGEVASRIARAFFGNMLPDGDCSPCDFRIVSRGGQHRVLFADGSFVFGCSSEAHLVGALDAAFDARLRGIATAKMCTIHSSCIEVSGGVVAFTGVSGSGKTTLALACAICGLAHAGDEFGLLDMDSALFCQAEYPIALKGDSNNASLPFKEAGDCLDMVSPYGIVSRLRSRAEILDILHARRADAAVWRPLVALVSVERQRGVKASIESLPVGDWLARLMPSIDAPISRTELFSRLVSLSSERGVKILRLKYDDSFDAARLIARYFQ